MKAGRDLGRTPDGVYDLAGNAWEWCRDWSGPYPYDTAAATDPLCPWTGTSRVLRGCSFYCVAHNFRGAYRSYNPPEIGSHNIGFRVVWSAARGP